MPRSTHEPCQLLRARKVSEVLDVTVRQVYRLVQQGDLEAVRVGLRHLRITRESLDELLSVLRGEARAVATGERDWRDPPLAPNDSPRAQRRAFRQCPKDTRDKKDTRDIRDLKD